MVNRKLLYCILIVCTLITSGTVVYILSYDYMINDEVEEIVEVKNEKSQETNKDYSVKKKDTEKQNQSEKQNQTTDVKDTKKNEPIKESSEQGVASQNGSTTTKKEETKPVFKVSAGSIEKSLSAIDKAKLLFIGSKLSTVDEGRVKDYLSDNNPEEGVRKAYKLLQQRLNEEDLNKVKEILEKYINIDAVENQ